MPPKYDLRVPTVSVCSPYSTILILVPSLFSLFTPPVNSQDSCSPVPPYAQSQQPALCFQTTPSPSPPAPPTPPPPSPPSPLSPTPPTPRAPPKPPPPSPPSHLSPTPHTPPAPPPYSLQPSSLPPPPPSLRSPPVNPPTSLPGVPATQTAYSSPSIMLKDATTKAKSTKLGIVGSVTGSLIGVTVLVFVILFLRRRRRRTIPRSGAQPEITPLENPSDVESNVIQPSRHGPVRYSYQQLCDATDSFDSSRLVGKGGFGPVYKGDIDGGLVAVKCIDDGSKQGFKEFKAEINIISDLRHRNLVRLRGWCYEDYKCFLVYQFVANGSVDTILFNDKRCEKELSWERRFRIVLGLGSAIQYLHEECEKAVIHRDIKSSNVLLDENYMAKLGDFGLSRQMEETELLTTAVAGTRGYIAPEVYVTGKSNKESDVFSFGAMLAEIACGKRAIDGRGMALVDWVWEHLSAGVLAKAADERLAGNFNKDEMVRVLLVALACSHPDPSARPPIRIAMDAIRGSTPLPSVPLHKPIPVYMTSSPSTNSVTSLSYGYGTTSTLSSSSIHNMQAQPVSR